MVTSRYLYYDRARVGSGRRRTSNTAYWLDNLIEGNVPPDAPPPEDLPEGLRAITDFARSPRRARNTAYWLDNLIEGNVPPDVAPEDLPEGQLAHLPDRAPGPIRTANTAYWFSNLLAGNVPPDVVEVADGMPLFPDFAWAPRRAANSAYWITNLIDGNVPPEVSEDLPEGQRANLPDRAPGPRARASNTEYWIINLVSGNVPPDLINLPEGQTLGMAGLDLSRDTMVAVPYWPTAFTISLPVNLPEGKSSIPDFARSPRRAANTVYWITNSLEGNVPPDVVPSVGRAMSNIAQKMQAAGF